MSRVALLDVNVLLALFDDGHVAHEAAHDWFADNRQFGWASCPITENGLLRVLGNPTQPAWYVPIPELCGRLAMFCSATEHHFWPDDLSIRDPARFEATGIRGHQQLTDVYLLGLAVRNDARFVTLDRGVPLHAVKGARREHFEVIAPA